MHLEEDADAKALFLSKYGVAYNFFYNPFYRKQLNFTYIGAGKDTPTIGPVRVDVVLVQNEALRLNSLHLHFIPSNNDYELGVSKNDQLLQTVVYLNRLYDSLEVKDRTSPPSTPLIGSLRELGRFLSIRKHTFPVSRYIYISVCNLPEDGFPRIWQIHPEDIYSLLWLHPRGVSAGISEEYLENHKWSATKFFWNFYQKAAVVSLSSPYPQPEYEQNPKWFFQPLRSTGGGEWSIPGGQFKGAGDGHERYDFLPEYPPLRYLGLLSLEFAGLIEETERDLHERLIGLSALRFPSSLKSVFELPRISDEYHESRGLDSLRLPTSREFAIALIEEKSQEDVRESIISQQTTLRDELFLFLAAAALLLALIQFGPLITVASRRLAQLLQNLVATVFFFVLDTASAFGS